MFELKNREEAVAIILDHVAAYYKIFNLKANEAV
jgi:hypothetical protein